MYYTIIPFLVHVIPYWGLCYFFYRWDILYMKNPYNWSKYKSAVWYSLFNQCCVGLPLLYTIEPYLISAIERNVMGDTMLGFLTILHVINCFFYLTHRMLHLPLLYRYIHYQHHEIIDSFAVSTYYTHPIEYLVSNMLSFFLPILILGSSYRFMITLILLSTVFSTLSHVTYVYNDHQVHHRYYRYNYGFGSYFDMICGTFRK